MSEQDEPLEHDPRPSGAIAVLAVSALGMLALPLVVLAAHAAGLAWAWAGVLGFFTPSLFLLLGGLVLAGVGARSTGREVVVPLRRGRSTADAPAAQAAHAA